MQSIKNYLPLLFAVLLISSHAAHAQAKNSDINLPNFGKINPQLYRGGQPTEAGVKRLAQMGVKTIIDLRGEDSLARTEARWAQNSGIKFINVDLSNWLKPKTTDIEEIIRQINAPENQPVFVHCRRGADRTGTVISVYRISQDNWTAQRAIEEAKNYNIGWWQFLMKDYIEDYYHDFTNRKTGKSS